MYFLFRAHLCMDPSIEHLQSENNVLMKTYFLFLVDFCMDRSIDHYRGDDVFDIKSTYMLFYVNFISVSIDRSKYVITKMTSIFEEICMFFPVHFNSISIRIDHSWNDDNKK